MKALYLLMLYRVSTLKTLGFLVLIGVINGVVYTVFAHPLSDGVSQKLYAPQFAVDYFLEGFFFLKVSLLLVLMILCERLFHTPSSDVSMIQITSRKRVYMVKWAVLLSMASLLLLLLFLMLTLMYGTTQFHHAYPVPWHALGLIVCLIIHYSALYIFVYQRFTHAYGAICIVLLFMISEMIMDIRSAYVESFHLLTVFHALVPNIYLFSYEQFGYSADLVINLCITTVVVTLTHVHALKQNY